MCFPASVCVVVYLFKYRNQNNRNLISTCSGIRLVLVKACFALVPSYVLLFSACA